MDRFILALPEVVIQLLAFALAISVHESAHAWSADRLGDSTARWLGRITLNPIKHVDPVGTVLFPLMLAFLGAMSGQVVPVFGWAKPVPVITRNLGNPRRDSALVGLAGPASNLLLALAATLALLAFKYAVPSFRPILRAVLEAGALGATGIAPPLLYLLFSLALVNLVLAVINLIPIPPLDGSSLVAAVLPARWAALYVGVQRFGFLLFFALLWTGLFGRLLDPFVRALVWIVLA